MISILMFIFWGCSDPKNIDQDDDGFIASEDCNDEDPNVHPLADEICNDIDDNCDGRINNDPIDGSAFLADWDGDGFGDDASQHILCAIEDGYVELSSGGDCDDDNSAAHPNAVELCNGLDDDCNNVTDDNPQDGTSFFRDLDGDGFGDASDSIFGCIQMDGYIEDNTDCDDSNANTFPGSAENDSLTDCMIDEDGDGYGSGNVAGNAIAGTDCNDSDAAVSPDASEVCDGIDNDCDLLIDDADDSVVDQLLLYSDLDGDGYGDPANIVYHCFPTEFAIEDSTDCDDTNENVNPSASEICDGIDNDCDGTTSESGMVYSIDAQGTGTDVTSIMALGTPSTLNMYEPSGEEALYFCEGTFSPTISTTSDITIQGIGDVTFLADGLNAPNFDLVAVRNYGDATSTSIDGIVFDGYNLAILIGSENNMYNELTMNDVLIRNGYSIVGAGINVQYTITEVTNSYFEDGAAGYGGLAITAYSSDLTLETVEISGSAGLSQVGVYASEYSLFDMVDTDISGFPFAGVVLVNSDGICTDSSSSSSGSSFSSSNHGLYLDASTWESNGCDYQSSSSQDENDVDIELADEASYYIGDNATFSCSETSCGTQTEQLFDGASSFSMSSKVYGNRYSTQSDVTVRSFSVPLEGDTCGQWFGCFCDVDFAMHMFEQGSWTQLWTGTRTGFFNGYVSSGTIGEPVRTGEEFALTVEYNCNNELTYRFGNSQSVPSNTFLTLESSYAGSGGTVPSPEGLMVNSASYYDQEVVVETVP